MRDKLKLTTHLVSQLPEEHSISVESARISWWFNVGNQGGLRLTALGFKTLSTYLDLEYYEYKIPDSMTFTMQTVLDLDRRLQHPYYITTKKGESISILFFGSKEAMLANLYGDISKFLDNYK